MVKKCIVAVFAASLFLSAAAYSAEYVMKLGHLTNTDHTWHKACERFKEIVEKETGGDVRIEIYPNDELGKEMEVIDSIHSGVAQMVISSDSLANWAPVVSIVSVPYMIRDSAHLQKFLDSDVAKHVDQQLIDKAELRPLAVFMRNPRNLTSNRPIKTPAEVNGIKLRIPDVPVFIAAWEALGAKPVPMAFTEVFTSLQQGVIDAQENPLDLIKSASFFEVQKYVDETEHLFGWIYLLVGEEYFQNLPKNYQDILVKAGKAAQAYELELNQTAAQELKKYLQDKGMTFVQVDKPAFAELVKPAVLKFLSPELQKMYQDIVAIQ